jgi:hypothetical protein
MFDDEVLSEFSIYFEYVSLVIALFYYRKYKDYSFYKYFVFYLLLIIIFEFIAREEVNNNWIEIFNNGVKVLNIFTFFEFNLVALIYYHLIKVKETLRLLKILAIIFNIIYFGSFFFLVLQTYTVVLEGVFNSVFIILYFRELLNSEQVLNYRRLLPFWISVGFLLYYLTSTPFFTLFYFNLLKNRNMFILLYYLIILYHTCFIFGLITCKKKKS